MGTHNSLKKHHHTTPSHCEASHTEKMQSTHKHSHTASHSHTHTHDPAETKAIINRLSRAIGHLESVKRMVEDGRDCSDVLIQLAAVKSALNNTGKKILKEHITHCIVEAIEEKDTEAIERLNQAIDSFMK